MTTWHGYFMVESVDPPGGAYAALLSVLDETGGECLGYLGNNLADWDT